MQICPSYHLAGACPLTCIQISQEAGQVFWYSHLFKNFPQFAVIHTVKSFSIVNEAEIDVFLVFSFFFSDPTNVDNLICGSSAFSAAAAVAQSYPTLSNPMDCSLPGSSLHGILQARVLEWVAIYFSRGSSQPRDRTWVSLIPGRCFNL